MSKEPKWLTALKENTTPTTRARSGKQESKIAKDLKGRTTINSGATFGENDITTDYCEIEAKTTSHGSFSLKVSDWKKARTKCDSKKMPLMVIEFETSDLELAVISYDDLKYLIEKSNQ